MTGSHFCIPRNETSTSEKQNYNVLFPVPTLFERFIFQDWFAYMAAGIYVDRSWDYINHSQPHECGNWDWGRAIPRKGIHKWDFPVSLTLHAIAVLNCMGRPSFPPRQRWHESAGHNVTQHVHCGAYELATKPPRQSCPNPHNVYTTQDFKNPTRPP